MNRLAPIIIAFLFPALALAAEGVVNHQFYGSIHDLTSLQKGAKYFVNYCSGCHTLKYLRYKRISDDLDIPKSLVLKNLDFTGAKFRQPMTNAMPTKEAKAWFGKAPPDLSQVARYRGPDWIYSYLLNFYLDPSRSTGVNNLTFPKTAMPDPLWQLQGWQQPVYKDKNKKAEIDHLKLVKKGGLSPEEYKQVAADITNFLVYAGEPIKAERLSLGFWVMCFLVILAAILYLLKREFWRDIH